MTKNNVKIKGKVPIRFEKLIGSIKTPSATDTFYFGLLLGQWMGLTGNSVNLMSYIVHEGELEFDIEVQKADYSKVDVIYAYLSRVYGLDLPENNFRFPTHEDLRILLASLEEK